MAGGTTTRKRRAVRDVASRRRFPGLSHKLGELAPEEPLARALFVLALVYFAQQYDPKVEKSK